MSSQTSMGGRSLAQDAGWVAPMEGCADSGGSIARELEPLQLMQRVTDQALGTIEAAEGVLVGVMIDADTLCYVSGSGCLAGQVGGLLALQSSLSGAAIRRCRTLITRDTERDPRVNRAATRSYGVRSSVCVPLIRGETALGVLNVSSSRPGAFDRRDVAVLRELAGFVSAAIAAASEFANATARLLAGPRGCSAPAGRFIANVLDPAHAQRVGARTRIERILGAEEFSLVFQPIVELHDASLFAAEALVRFESSQTPDAVIAQAHEVGLGVELEVAIARAALSHLRRLPRGVILTLNVGPLALRSHQLARALANADPTRVIIELTEQAEVEDYPKLTDCLRALRHTGVRLAIDDAGAGFASMTHVLKLAPDFIKLDRQLMCGIDIDPVRRSLVGALARFAMETGATVIGEGIETDAELAAVRDLGIHYGQGFHLARPGPIDRLSLSTDEHRPIERGARIDLGPGELGERIDWPPVAQPTA